MRSIGEPYSKDDLIDKTGFLKRARLHQSTFRALGLDQKKSEPGLEQIKQIEQKGLNYDLFD